MWFTWYRLLCNLNTTSCIYLPYGSKVQQHNKHSKKRPCRLSDGKEDAVAYDGRVRIHRHVDMKRALMVHQNEVLSNPGSAHLNGHRVDSHPEDC